MKEKAWGRGHGVEGHKFFVWEQVQKKGGEYSNIKGVFEKPRTFRVLGRKSESGTKKKRGQKEES